MPSRLNLCSCLFRAYRVFRGWFLFRAVSYDLVVPVFYRFGPGTTKSHETTRNHTNEVPVSALRGILKFLSKDGTRSYSPVGRIDSRSGGVVGLSSEVSFNSSGVADTIRVRHMKIEETTRATVHAAPPSIP